MKFSRLKLLSASALAGVLALGALNGPAQAQEFGVANLVSDGAVPAAHIDPTFANPWGMSYGPGGPIWVSVNGAGTTTVYNGSGGTVLPPIAVFPGAGSSSPTGQVFNSTASDFNVTNGTGTAKAVFLFATEGGTISGWAPTLDFGHTLKAVDNTGTAIYKGVTIGSNAGVNTLYATNFGDNMVDMFNGSFAPTGSFTDATLPGYAPFNAQVLNGHLFVTFAQHSTGTDEVDGAGLGAVDEYNLDGTFDRRIASPGGPVNAPWGLAIAPSTWGHTLAGDLLVGNFGDGTIDAYDLTTGAFDGVLQAKGGGPLVIDGLWGLIPGSGGFGESPNNIYFAAGINDEADGLFGFINVPEPATWTVMILGFGFVGAAMRRRVRLSAA